MRKKTLHGMEKRKGGKRRSGEEGKTEKEEGEGQRLRRERLVLNGHGVQAEKV